MCQHHARHAEGAGAAEQRASRRGQTRTWHPSAAVRSGRRAADCLAAAGFFGLLPAELAHGTLRPHRRGEKAGTPCPDAAHAPPASLAPLTRTSAALTHAHANAPQGQACAGACRAGPRAVANAGGYQNVKTGDLHKSTCAKERDSSSRHGGSTRLWPGCAAENWGSGGAGPRSSHALVPAPTLARRRRTRGARGLLCGLLGRLGRRSGRAAGRSRAAA